MGDKVVHPYIHRTSGLGTLRARAVVSLCINRETEDLSQTAREMATWQMCQPFQSAIQTEQSGSKVVLVTGVVGGGTCTK
jgi:hypothetical protein